LASGSEHPDVAASLDTVASLHRHRGEYARAEPLHLRALAIRERALAPDDPDLAESLTNLAVFHTSQGHHARAEQLQRRALGIYERALGSEHPDVAAALGNLASVYRSLGQYGRAEPLQRRALAIEKKALGPEHPDVAWSLNGLAVLYHDQGRYTEAEDLHRRALAVLKEVLGPEHPDVALSLGNLATLYRDQGRYEEAEPLQRRTLAIREKVLGAEHPDVATSLNELAVLHLDQGRYEQAEPLYRRALAIHEKAQGPEHPDAATALSNLAALFVYQGRYEPAEPLLRRALAIDEKARGPEHPEVATDLHNLAALYSNQGRHVEAEPLVRRALAIKEKALGPDHPDLAPTLDRYALVLGQMDRGSEAAPLQARAEAIRAKAAAAGAKATGRPLHYEREITTEDLEERSLYELTLMRNTIFARAGNRFRKKWLHDYFERQSFYRPTGLDESKLTELDRKNVRTIAGYEAAIPRAELGRRRDELLERHRWAWLPSTTALAFSADAKLLLTGHSDGRVALWEVPSGKLVRFLREQPGTEQDPSPAPHYLDEVLAAGFSADGRSAMMGTLRGTLLRWSLGPDAPSEPVRRELGRKSEGPWVTVAAFALPASGSLAVVADWRDGIAIHPVEDGAPPRALPRPDRISSLDVLLDPQGRVGLWLGYAEEKMALFDTSSGNILRTLDRPRGSRTAVFSRDGRLLALAGLDELGPEERTVEKIRLIDVSTGAVTAEIEGPEDHWNLNALEFSPDGKGVYGVDLMPGTVTRWDAASGQRSWEPTPDSTVVSPLATDANPDRVVLSLVASSDGRWLAVASAVPGESGDVWGQPQLLDTRTGRRAPEWKGHEPFRYATRQERIEAGLLSRALGLPEPFPPEGDTTPLDDPKLLEEPITVKQLADLSPRDLRILRNMVYARCGRPFRSRVLQEYFGRLEWYRPDPAYTDARLTRLDHQNIRVIQGVEAELGGPITEDEHAQWFFWAG